MRLTPDDFPIVMNSELRSLWPRYPDVNVRRLILEVHRAREVQSLNQGNAQTGLYCMHEKQYGLAMVEFQKIVDRVFNECVRLGCIGGIPVPTPIKR